MVDYEKIFESQYDGLCDVYEFQKVTDPITHQTTTKKVKVLEGIKCRLLFKSFPESSDGVVSGLKKEAKLTLSPSYTIKKGSILVVTQCGVTETYESSGIPAKYRYHQEINLKASDKYA